MANRPQSLSKGQQTEVLSILHSRLFAYFLTALGLIGGVMGVGLWQIKNRLEQQMESMIADQFREPRISQTVSDVAAKEAQELLFQQIQPEVELFKTEIAKKAAEAGENVAKVERSVVAAANSVSELEEMTEFMMIVLAAQNDDRKAFDELEKLSKDASHKFSVQARRAWASIFEKHSAPFSIGAPSVPWKENIDPSKLSLSDLREIYNSAHDWIRAALVAYTWSRQEFPKIDRLEFMIDVMKTDSSLSVVETAGRRFTEGTGQNIKPLAVSHLSDWWDKNRAKFVEEKPSNTESSLGVTDSESSEQP